MTESELKRYLVKSIRAQNGIGHRIEDKYMVGWPDLIMLPVNGPVFFAEAKLVKGIHLLCTAQQDQRLKDLEKPPFCHGVVLGYSKPREALYIGKPRAHLDACRFVPRPRVLDSAEWWITELLGKYTMDNREEHEYNQRVNPSPTVSHENPDPGTD